VLLVRRSSAVEEFVHHEAGVATAEPRREEWVATKIIAAFALMCSCVANARNVALLVGVGQFRDPALQTEQLLGTAADVDAVQKTLTDRWRFAPGDVHVLRDQDATRARILAEIAALNSRSAAGDTVVIYFSGHGTSANDNNNAYDLPYATGAWVPYDLDYSTNTSISRTLIVGRRDLLPLLKQLDDGGRWVVVVSDSCYSGQVVRSFGKSHSHSRYLPVHARDLGVAATTAPLPPAPRPDPPPYPYHHVVLLSGASDSEQGMDISSPEDMRNTPTLDNRYHGAFTDAFLRLLNGQLLTGSFTYAQGRDAMLSFMEHRNFAQHPQLLPAIAEDPQNIGSNLLFTPAAAAPAASPAATNAAPAARANTVRVALESVSPVLKATIAALSGVMIVDRGGDLTVRQTATKVQLLGPAGDPILATVASDPNLPRRIAAQAWLNRVLPAASGSAGLRAETNPGSRGNTFVQCESFVFEVRLDKPAYVMLLDLDPQGGLTVLYPSRPSERTVIASGAPRAIPSDDPKDHILVTAPFGSDAVTVLAFGQAPAFFSDLSGAARFDLDSKLANELATGLASVRGDVDVQRIAVNTYAGNSHTSCGT
jgi:Caspase domain/Domain of unknown function (DUF4384)